MKYQDVEGFEMARYNIDTKFSAVEYLDISRSLSGISIDEVIETYQTNFQNSVPDLQYLRLNLARRQCVKTRNYFEWSTETTCPQFPN